MSNIDASLNGYNQLFPTSAVNQSSQGFRNNFSSIYTNFTTAATELSKLQTTTIQATGDVTFLTTILDSAVSTSTGTSSVWTVHTTTAFNPNPVFPGNASLTLVSGTTLQRPATPVKGMIRYNSTTNNLETFVNNSWVILSTIAGQSTYILRSGDIVTGSLTMLGTTSTAQIIGDVQTLNTPSYTFTGDLGTGLSHPSGKNIGLMISNSNAVIISKSTNNYIADHSPNNPINNIIVTNPSDLTNTKIHGQYRGFQKSFEYYTFKAGCSNTSLAGDWFNIVTWDASVPSPVSCGYNFDFSVSGVGSSSGTGFVVQGYAIGSFLFDSTGTFISDPATTPDIDGSVYGFSPNVNLQTTQTGMSALSITVRLVQQSSLVALQIRCANRLSSTASLDFDVSGKISINFSSLGMFPITVQHD